MPALFVLAWSSAYVVGAMGIRSTPPFTLTFLRFAVATACMALIALAVRARWPSSRRELGHLAVAGTLVQGVQFLGVYAGIELGVPAAISSLVIGISPVLTALLARPVLGERVSRRRRWGFVLGVAGVVLAVSRGLHPTSHAFAGIGLTPLSLLALSGGTVYQKRFCPDMELRTGQTMRLLASTVLAGACSLASGTLYPILGRLTDRGMLETCWEDDPPEGRPRRHLYRLTAQGAERAAALRHEPASAPVTRPRPAVEGA